MILNLQCVCVLVSLHAFRVSLTIKKVCLICVELGGKLFLFFAPLGGANPWPTYRLLSFCFVFFAVKLNLKPLYCESVISSLTKRCSTGVIPGLCVGFHLFLGKMVKAC